MGNPSTRRRWLQTAGLPLEPDTAALRPILDAINRVEVTPQTSRLVLRDDNDQPIGLLDLHPRHKANYDQTLAVLGEPRERDPANGDTVIRDLDPEDPFTQRLLQGGGFRLLQVGEEEPPIDLPDYQPPARALPRGILLGNIYVEGVACLIVATIANAIITLL